MARTPTATAGATATDGLEDIIKDKTRIGAVV